MENISRRNANARRKIGRSGCPSQRTKSICGARPGRTTELLLLFRKPLRWCLISCFAVRKVDEAVHFVGRWWGLMPCDCSWDFLRDF
jgi:hypothetical protein